MLVVRVLLAIVVCSSALSDDSQAGTNTPNPGTAGDPYVWRGLTMKDERRRNEGNKAYVIARAESPDAAAPSAGEKSPGNEQAAAADQTLGSEQPPEPTKAIAPVLARPAVAERIPPTQAAVAVPREPPPDRTLPRKDLPPPAQSDESTAPAKPASLIQMLEGREEELMLWLGIAATFFVIGWICGGNYYLRRDRKRRRKLRF